MIKVSNGTAFVTGIESLAKRVNLTRKLVVQKMTADIWTKLTYRTPVDTGRARASWNIAQGAPNTSVPPEAKKGEKIPTPTMPSLDQIDGTQPVFVTSNVEYMTYLNEGTSKQAPAKFIEFAAAETLAEAQLAAEAARGL